MILKVDPGRSGAPFAVGTETLLPGAQLPIHRHLDRDVALFVHKGQGRATLEGEGMTVVPGTVVYAPKQAWHGLRNTGTGVLQLLWVSAPSGIQEFFRELARAGAAASGAVLQEIAGRHGVEFSPDGAAMAAPAPEPRRRHRRRRGGRGRQGVAPPQGQSTPPTASLAPASPLIAPHAPAGPGQPPGRAGGPSTALPGPPFTKAGAGGAPSREKSRDGGPAAAQPTRQAAPPRKAGTQAAPSAGGRARREGGPRRSRRRVKEVYMGGRWVRVTGEGPVISTESGPPEAGGAEAES